MINLCSSGKKELCAIKVDFYKAFDCVSWDFLINLLKARGFSNTWCSWILNILSSAKSVVLVNGSPSAFFQCHRGLKQGDPLSPLLFLLIVDVLTKMISSSALSGDLSDLNLKGELNHIRTLQFADDTLIFCKATRRDIHTLKIILRIFGLTSGLSMNQAKSHLYYLGRIPNNDDSLHKPKKIVDVGCGLGGSCIYLARKYGADCCGITLSAVQAQRAQALAAAEGLADKVSYQVADALNQPFPDGQFDLVWSMECAEHIPDKTKFVSELERVAAPGATIVITTWCHRDLCPDEVSLNPKEKNLLNKLSSSHYLPNWCSAADYVKSAQSLNLLDIKTDDWSENVMPFWPAVLRSLLTWRGLISFLGSGWKTIRGAPVMPKVIEGYKKNVVKYTIITCRKPL
ncbi:probable tocopherol O-methyltransferase, chloroplastic [Asparagus officinalis]|uniref:probable tocopherol O-methyltransferase, chloroplastic n=1 Tax=Asparagus officinalis TaxID=4686 RepID=UPI00098E044D|nr:probable tocopherol O-methyltransferase, chloroplastic [Asparagus officinalis]